MHCANRTFPAIAELLKESDLPEPVILARISIWQEKNGLDKVPTLEQINNTFENTTFSIKGWEKEHTKQSAIWDALKAEESATIKLYKEDGDSDGYGRVNEDGRPVKNRVSDIVKGKSSLSQNFDDKPENKFIAKYGTDIHTDIENIINRYVDENGFIKFDEGGNLVADTIGKIATTESQYKALEEWIRDMLTEYNTPANRGVRIRTESIIYSPKHFIKGKNGGNEEVAGTIDFLAIHPDGKVDILDWKSYNLNKKLYNDVPWFKTEHVNNQITEYKKILKDNYGVKEFGRERGIPIALNMTYNQANKTWTINDFEVGNYKTSEETRDYVLPIPTMAERTGNKKIDYRLDKFNALYDVLNKEEKTATGERKFKIREEKALVVKAMRMIQVKYSLEPTITLLDLHNQVVNDYIVEYQNTLKNKNISDISNKEVEEYSRKIKNIADKFTPFEDIDVDLKDLYEEHPELKENIKTSYEEFRKVKDGFNDIWRDFVNRFVGEKNGEIYLLQAELEVGGLNRLFTTMGDGATAALGVAHKLLAPTVAEAKIEIERELKRQSVLEEAFKTEMKKTGKSSKELYDILRKPGTNQRIDKYDENFYTTVKDNIKQVKNKNISVEEYNKRIDNYHTWLENNIDLDKFKEFISKREQEEISWANNNLWSTDAKEQAEKLRKRLDEIDNRYNIKNNKAPGWFNSNILSRFPKENWESPEYKTLKTFPAAMSLYNYIGDKINEASSLGFFNGNKRNWLPYRENRGFLSAPIKPTVKNTEQGKVSVNALTGERTYTLPFISLQTGENFDGDIFSALTKFNQEFILNKGISSIENRLLLLRYSEYNKEAGAMVSDFFNRPNKIKGTEKIENRENIKNAVLFDDFLAANVYSIRNNEDQKDTILLTLGSTPDKMAKGLNNIFGRKVFADNLEGKSITALGVAESMGNYYQATVLLANFGIPLSNLFGGHFQAAIGSGVFMTNKDMAANEIALVGTSLAKSEEGKKKIAFIHETVSFTENLENEQIKKHSIDKLAHFVASDALYKVYQMSDKPIQHMVSGAMWDNAIVVDGKIVNARTYVRNKYSSRYEINNLTSKEQQTNLRKIEKQIEEEIKEIREKQGVIKLSTVDKDGLLIYPVDIQEIAKYSSKIKSVLKQITGQMTQNDRNLLNTYVLGRAAMTFKNWIQPLATTRFGGLKYNTALETVEWGRMRSFSRFLIDSFKQRQRVFRNVRIANSEGIAYMQKLIEQKKKEYFDKTGKELDISQAEFMDMLRNNVKAQYRDMALTATLFAMMLLLRGMVPDSDDPDKESRAKWAFMAKQMQKVSQELTFFYNPLDMQQIANGSIFPSLGAITNSAHLMININKEIFGDEDTKEHTHALKNVFDMLPVVRQMDNYAAYASPEWAKYMGIKVNSNIALIK